MQKIQPCLWFNNQAEEAAALYTTLFENSAIGGSSRYSASGAKASGQKEGSVMTVEFELSGQKMLALNGGPHFKFTPALSFFVWCGNDADIEHLWQTLSRDGTVRMALDTYPWARKYGWTADRFGVEWQFMVREEKAEKNDSGQPRHRIAPAFLFVDRLFGKGEEALQFYQSVFSNSTTEFATRDDATNTLMHCVFTLDRTPFTLMEGKGNHGYTFSPAFSLMVLCNDQVEIDRYWSKLSAVPEAEQCGWLQDKYGVSWQIVPAILRDLMTDSTKSERAMRALLQMKKPDIAKLQDA